MYTFLLDAYHDLHGAGPTLFMGLFAYVWIVWAAKALIARRYQPVVASPLTNLTTTVIVPVFNEPETTFRRALSSVRANGPTEFIAVVDGGDDRIVDIAEDYCDRVLSIRKSGKRAAIAAGFAAADPQTEIIIVLDSDTIWEPTALQEMLRPFADPRVGGVTPRQAIFGRDEGAIRRFADWIEDLRYHLTVPAQSVFGQVGCLAGRTIAYRREAFAPAVERLLDQTVLGVPQHIGDDRVLTNELLRNGWRCVYQSTAIVKTDAPATWPAFCRQQLRWARSSQRETLLSLGWLWRKPAAFSCFLTDIITPFAVYTVFVLALAHAAGGSTDTAGVSATLAVPLGYLGMLTSLGLRQIPHLRRARSDLLRLPVFVLMLTFLMIPIRLLGFATMLHQSWSSRPATFSAEVLHEAPVPQSAHP